ncbi:MAG: AMP-binding protein [Alphaproteobacteria bacterium]|nr:AMP-binding protein [Alphaproteobacteria bacterium]
MILVHDFLTASAARFPQRAALIRDGRRVSFAELDRDSDQLAAAFQDWGLTRGERVLSFLENSVEMVIALFATWKAGGVFVPVHPATKADKLAYMLNDCGVRWMVTEPALAGVAEEVAAQSPALAGVLWTGERRAGAQRAESLDDVLRGPHRAPADPGLIDNDLCVIIYTSGSTGLPKGVMLTHANMANTARSISTYLGNVPEDVVICVLPLSFDYGLYQVVTGALIGFSVVLEKSFAYPWETMRRMAEERVTGLPGVPTIFARLLQMAPFEGLDLGCLRYMTNTAATLPLAHLRRLGELFPATRIFSMYGLTECTRVSWLPPERLAEKAGSVGRAIPNGEVWVAGEDGAPLPPGEVGELVIRGAHVMRGYWGKPAETARALRDGTIQGEKVLHSGDLFRMDAEGFLYFVGRRDDVFKCRGHKVSPKEVEDILYELEDVAEAAVIAVDHPLDGKAVKAFVARRQGSALTEDELRRHCRARLEPHLVPRFFELVAELPKTDTGKIRKGNPRRAG